MTKLLLVGLGGCLGALARYGISGYVQEHWGGFFPLGTLAVNLVGCFILGALMSFTQEHPLFSPNTRSFLGTGMIGALTTFSTFSYETSELLYDRRMLAAGGNIVLNVALGLVAVELGRLAARALGA